MGGLRGYTRLIGVVLVAALNVIINIIIIINAIIFIFALIIITIIIDTCRVSHLEMIDTI